MNQYQNKNRPGLRSSTTADPKAAMQDIDYRIRRLDPDATPLQVLSRYFGRGPVPKSHKVQVVQYHSFDNFDYCSSNGAGDAGEERMLRLVLDQRSRPSTNSAMLYYPQDKFFIAETGQVVEVVMNERAALQLGENTNAEITVSTTLSGNTTSRSLAGTVVVRNIEPAALLPFTTSDVIYLGRTIAESQSIQAEPQQRDYVYDCNFVEHKEAVIIMTEDQKNLVQMEGVAPDWNMQQTECFKEFTRNVEFTAMFGERSPGLSVDKRPTRHMRGLFNAIRTNVAYYDPINVVGFEEMFINFLVEQGFRYNPNKRKKIALCGARFLINFNLAFRDYRRTSDLSGIGKTLGLNADTYIIPGGFEVQLIRSEMLHQNTKLENWCFIIDPTMAEWCVNKDYNSRMYKNPSERDFKLMVEWQGTIKWQLEQTHALLRT
ncbi:hypothetical protein LCGC14_0341970 [marine sediment metagenome]|uniref:Uncharacterized protein n=1 Tax=marine sediment metagenome TaxID=412755 RepID=A0A0F9TD32_9ZZZZ